MKPFADRRHLRAFECDLVALDRFDRRFGQRRAVFLLRLSAEDVRFPFDIDARRLDNPNRCRDDLRADAVAGDECNSVFHFSDLLVFNANFVIMFISLIYRCKT